MTGADWSNLSSWMRRIEMLLEAILKELKSRPAPAQKTERNQ